MPKKIILSTAGLPSESIASIHDAGWDCRILDCITIICKTEPSLKEAIQQLDKENTAAIFTSANAVKAVANLVENPDCIQWQIYCLSGKTAEAVRNHFSNALIRATAPDSAALATLPEIHQHRSYHFFCGGSRMDTLPKLLQQVDIDIHEHIVYETILNKPLLDFEPYAALFFSPSAIESLMARNDLSQIPILVCIGKSTAAALPSEWSSKVLTAPTHSKQSVVETLLQTLQNATDIC